MRAILLGVSLLLTGCTGIPENVIPVEPFSLERYLGTWYEIARLDHSFERGLSRVTAEYSLREDGGVRVINKGYSESKQAWSQAEGRAYVVERQDLGYLKVSFFCIFFGSYVVIELDREGYQYALVCGPSTSYLWILARSPRLAQDVTNRLVSKAAALGFDTSRLIYVEHPPEGPGAQAPKATP